MDVEVPVRFRLSLAGITWCVLIALPGTGQAAPFMRGADLSIVQYAQDHGVTYQDDGHAADPLLIVKRHGCNTVRLRLFVSPDGADGQVNTLAYTLRLAQRVKAAGLGLLLDLHYSDGWADPSHQATPAAWRGLPHEQLVARVRAYTRQTIAAFAQADAMPDCVEVGNEITNGMLWPDGGPFSSATQWNQGPSPALADDQTWDRFTDLLRAGIAGVHDGDPAGRVRIMIHIDKGSDAGLSRWFFDHLVGHDVRFDVVGLSYYPFWNGSLKDLRQNLASLAARYGKDIVIVETGFDAGGGPQGTLPFPPNARGQRDFVQAMIRTVAATPAGHGGGVCYWAADWIDGKQWNGPDWSGQWESRALFDPSGAPRPALDALGTTPDQP